MVPVCGALEGGARCGAAPRVVLAATHETTLEFASLDDLKRFALDIS